MDQIDTNGHGVKKKFEEEIGRYKHFKRCMFGTDKIEEKIRKKAADIISAQGRQHYREAGIAFKPKGLAKAEE